MHCEICGKNSKKNFSIELDGSKLVVCKACASFGSNAREISRQPIEKEKIVVKKMKKIEKKKRETKKADEVFDLGLDLVADYGKLVRKARENKNLTIEELGKKIFEKASTINRIESQALVPSNELIKKLETVLEISLRENLSKEQ